MTIEKVVEIVTSQPPHEGYKTQCLHSVFGSMRKKAGFSGCGLVSGGHYLAGSNVSELLGYTSVCSNGEVSPGLVLYSASFTSIQTLAHEVRILDPVQKLSQGIQGCWTKV